MVAFVLGGLLLMTWNGRKKINTAINDWQQAGHTVTCRPTNAVRYSALPWDRDYKHLLGTLAITNQDLLFRNDAGETEIIPLSDVQWIASGYMWRGTFGAIQLSRHLLVNFQGETLAFHTYDSRRLCRHLSERHNLRCTRIPRGHRVWNSRLIVPPKS